ncbi:MAG: 16S rRNA (cytidine(1402)-2'-O)-methyltransferase, partial [Candidatus Omnitrophota bacterium]
TIVLYESPHRFIRLLNELKDIFPEAELTVAREVTKKFEEIKKGNPLQMLDHFNNRSIKGELVVVVNNRGNF